MTGRPKTTGRFETRAELVERVRSLYFDTDLSMAAVARNCKVSAGVANDIYERKEWDSLTDADRAVQTSHTEEFEVDVNLDSRTLSACGSGYDFAVYPLHIPDRIKRDLDLI